MALTVPLLGKDLCVSRLKKKVKFIQTFYELNIYLKFICAKVF